MHPPIEQRVDHLFRTEAGRMVAVLTKLFGFEHMATAEDVVQETLLLALNTWKHKGLPDNPRAWLYRAARNQIINVLRRERLFEGKIGPQLAQILDNDGTDTSIGHLFLDHEIEDAQLRMMFACCHPTLSPEAQIILILKTLCGLGIKEIAAALFAQEDAVAKKLYRTKEKIKAEGIALEVPIGTELGQRFEAVLKAIYLLFNEGYKSAFSETVIRHDLAEEAIRLGLLLHHAKIRTEGFDRPKANALLALMCYHTARFPSRLDQEGQIVLLEHQDRSLWDNFLLQQAHTFFRAAETEHLSTYHAEAAIAHYHALAPSFEATNWQAIYYCYQVLYALAPSPTVALNRTIALGYNEGPQKGIAALLELENMDKNPTYHVALGDFYQKNGETEKAHTAYALGLKWIVTEAERRVVLGKMGKLSNG
jgi:RNA polymerase sigma factor (sigma-70 family)